MKTVEIERKFLIDKDKFFEYLSNCSKREKKCIQVSQYYAHIDDKQEIRIRFIKYNGEIFNGYIFIKYFDDQNLLSRREFESTMDKQTREEYNKYIIDNNIKCVEKDRYAIIYSGHLFEIDIFKDDNEGLCLAEVELFNKNDSVELPDFILKEVTGDVKYYNKNLYINPYKNWKE